MRVEQLTAINKKKIIEAATKNVIAINKSKNQSIAVNVNEHLGHKSTSKSCTSQHIHQNINAHNQTRNQLNSGHNNKQNTNRSFDVSHASQHISTNSSNEECVHSHVHSQKKILSLCEKRACSQNQQYLYSPGRQCSQAAYCSPSQHCSPSQQISPDKHCLPSQQCSPEPHSSERTLVQSQLDANSLNCYNNSEIRHTMLHTPKSVRIVNNGTDYIQTSINVTPKSVHRFTPTRSSRSVYNSKSMEITPQMPDKRFNNQLQANEDLQVTLAHRLQNSDNRNKENEIEFQSQTEMHSTAPCNTRVSNRTISNENSQINLKEYISQAVASDILIDNSPATSKLLVSLLYYYFFLFSYKFDYVFQAKTLNLITNPNPEQSRLGKLKMVKHKPIVSNELKFELDFFF